MIFVLLNWTYILVISFIIGYGVLHGVEQYFGYRCKKLDSYIVAGLVILTAYSQWFSIFYRVNWEANLALQGICLLILIFLGKDLFAQLDECWHETGRTKKVAILILAVVISYFTSRGTFISDTNLYHAQSIRWIEEYGVLKGLANIQSRAAYNSSSFCLSALFSMKYFFGQSMHALQGFMAFLLACVCTELGHLLESPRKVYGALRHRAHREAQEKEYNLLRKKPKLSDFAIIGAIYYLTLLHDEIMSPSSDYAVMIILFYIVIKWLLLLEEKEDSEVPYSLLCVVGVYTVTLKLTAGLILLLLVKPVAMLIKRKKWNEIVMYVLMGIVVVAPYLIRNVIISGYLIYPLTALDLFQVDWKVPAQIVDADAFQIKSWGKGIHEYGMYEAGPAKWWPVWFKTMLTGTEKALILADIVSLVILAVQSIRQIVRKQNLDTLLVMWTVTASFLYWQFSAPLTRYGYTYILLVTLLVWGDLYLRTTLKMKQTFLYIVLSVFLLWKGVVLVQGAWSTRLLDNYVCQIDYDNNEDDDYVKPFEINGITFYYGVSGYHKLPGGGIAFTMRTDRLQDGFKYADKNEIDVFGERVR